MTEIERLQDENARLQRQLSVAGVTQLPNAEFPSADELAELRSMVLRRYPTTLTCSLDQFERAIRYLAFARRQKEPNKQVYPVFWLDACRDWLRKQGYDTNISLRALVAACVASGVTYTPLDRWPFDVELGLARGDVSKPSSGWKTVLANGVLPAPTPLDRPRQFIEQQTMIQTDTVLDARGGSGGTRIERS